MYIYLSILSTLKSSEPTRCGTNMKNDREAFFRLVMPVPESGCWLWLGEEWKGYGRFCWNGKANRRAHHISLELAGISIPKGMVCDHTCRVRCCVNPAHIRFLTNKQNILIGKSFSALNAAKTVCSRGHAFNGDNLVIRKDGSRECRACHKLREKQRVRIYG